MVTKVIVKSKGHKARTYTLGTNPSTHFSAPIRVAMATTMAAAPRRAFGQRSVSRHRPRRKY
jgi:hypothetical protein